MIASPPKPSRNSSAPLPLVRSPLLKYELDGSSAVLIAAGLPDETSGTNASGLLVPKHDAHLGASVVLSKLVNVGSVVTEPSSPIMP